MKTALDRQMAKIKQMKSGLQKKHLQTSTPFRGKSSPQKSSYVPLIQETKCPNEGTGLRQKPGDVFPDDLSTSLTSVFSMEERQQILKSLSDCGKSKLLPPFARWHTPLSFHLFRSWKGIRSIPSIALWMLRRNYKLTSEGLFK